MARSSPPHAADEGRPRLREGQAQAQGPGPPGAREASVREPVWETAIQEVLGRSVVSLNAERFAQFLEDLEDEELETVLDAIELEAEKRIRLL